MFYYALAMAIAWSGVALYLLVNSRKVRLLHRVEPVEWTDVPELVIIVAVRNEEAQLREAMERLSNLQYSRYRVLAINDRSTDRTPQIMQELSARYPRFSYHTIDTLPEGWLGKNHALYIGVQQTTEPWILFTDADVHFATGALDKAMYYVQAHRLDHLTVLPEVTSRAPLFSSVMETFKIMLELQQKPWLAKDPRSRSSLGVGAFNLLSREAYLKAGTHSLISLRPDDDLQLGKILKQSGGRQDVLYGDGEIWLDWYSSLGEFVNGLMKNTFSVFDYQWWKASLAALATILVFVLPLPLMLLGGSTERILAGIMLAAQFCLFLFKRGMRGVWWYALMIPVAGLVMTYILVASTYRTLKQGGIYWRETFYPLDVLRKQRSR